jgi:hypothetical protein
MWEGLGGIDGRLKTIMWDAVVERSSSRWRTAGTEVLFLRTAMRWIIRYGNGIERSVLNDSTNGNGTVRNDTELRNAINVPGETVRTERLEALAWKYLVEGQSATRSGHESGRNEKRYFMDRLAKILKRLGHRSQR